MHVKAAEEISRRQREIDRLVEENRNLQNLKESSLESQRKDLTASFEKILSQREEIYMERERQLETKFSALQITFEKIRAENLESKAEARDMRIKMEATVSDNIMKEESIRKLRWAMEDQRLKNEDTEDTLKRKLLSALNELQQNKVTAADTKANFVKEVENVLSSMPLIRITVS